MLQRRPPIVTVLGHVDHGKTTLLDVIRKTNIASREAGGITQSIGASKVLTKEGYITFVDTPGHAAFKNMRAQGVKVADIAVLVVAADAGVKPQTIEAIDYIKQVGIPMVVALTKVDLPSANTESVKSQLEKEGIGFEGRGGDTPVINVSAKQGKGIEDLIETLFLVAQVNEIKTSSKDLLEGTIIEVRKDKRGILASIVIRNGILKVGDSIVASDVFAKVKGMFDEYGKPVTKALPGDPVLVLGFSRFPTVGAGISFSSGTTAAQEQPVSTQVIKVDQGELPVVLKASSKGGLDALSSNLPKGVVAVSLSVGDVVEADIFFAKATGATIIAFDSRVSPVISKLAATEAVKIEKFNIIYKAIERLEELLKVGKQEVLGKAEIVASFPFKNKKVAGCKVTEGRIVRGSGASLMAAGRLVGKVKIISMRRGKNDIEEAKAGEECGILFEPQLDFNKGDVLVSVK